MTDSSLIPNSYQMPNKYCDQFMYLLTPAEWKVLSYAARRIFGFQKRQDRISLSQFVRGTISRKDGLPLDHGTGLSKPTVIACLDSLIKYRLVIKLAPAENNPRKEDGDLYALQLDYDSVDYAGLVDRANSHVKDNLLRTAPGRNQAKAKRLSIPLTGQSDLPVEPVNPIDHYRSIPLTTTGQSDLPELVNRIDTQNQVGNKEETQRDGISHSEYHNLDHDAPDASISMPLHPDCVLTGEQAWQAALSEMQLEMARATFDAWVKPTKLLSVNGTWKIGTPNKYAQEWLDRRLMSTVKRILAGVVGQSVVIEFVVMK